MFATCQPLLYCTAYLRSVLGLHCSFLFASEHLTYFPPTHSERGSSKSIRPLLLSKVAQQCQPPLMTQGCESGHFRVPERKIFAIENVNCYKMFGSVLWPSSRVNPGPTVVPKMATPDLGSPCDSPALMSIITPKYCGKTVMVNNPSESA